MSEIIENQKKIEKQFYDQRLKTVTTAAADWFQKYKKP